MRGSQYAFVLTYMSEPHCATTRWNLPEQRVCRAIECEPLPRSFHEACLCGHRGRGGSRANGGRRRRGGSLHRGCRPHCGRRRQALGVVLTLFLADASRSTGCQNQRSAAIEKPIAIERTRRSRPAYSSALAPYRGLRERRCERQGQNHQY